MRNYNDIKNDLKNQVIEQVVSFSKTDSNQDIVKRNEWRNLKKEVLRLSEK